MVSLCGKHNQSQKPSTYNVLPADAYNNNKKKKKKIRQLMCTGNFLCDPCHSKKRTTNPKMNHNIQSLLSDHTTRE